MNCGQGFVFTTSQCLYLWGILQHFRAIGDSLFHVYVLYSQNDKSICPDTIENMIWKYFPLVRMCSLPIQAKPTSHWHGQRADKEVSTFPRRGRPHALSILHTGHSLRNCLNILALEYSFMTLLLAACFLENVPTSLSLVFHACQNGNPFAALMSLL